MSFSESTYRSIYRLAGLIVVGLTFLTVPIACGDSADDSEPTTRQQAMHVDPITISGNPSCEDVGAGDFELKIKPESGTYAIDAYNDVTVSVDGAMFDWSSTLSLDAVIVKGGPDANLYDYVPEATSDSGLHAPQNTKNGKYYGLSHISFCYDYELDVSKTAATSLTRTYGWTIDKSVAPSSHALFTGDDATSTYTVAVTKDGGTESDWAASGAVTVENNTPYDATIESITDTVSPSIAATLDCGTSFPTTLAAGADLSCSYTVALPDGTNRVNTATVTTSGMIEGGDATVDVDFSAATVTKVNDAITVDDSNGMSWTFAASGSETYTRSFACDGDAGTHDNTATIVETLQSSGASVSVSCYTLSVTKTADPALIRTYQWSIDKSVTSVSSGDLSAGPPQLVIEEDPTGVGQGDAGYAVTLTKTGSVDSDWTVTGSITIANGHPTRAASLTGVTDVISPSITASVTCPAADVPAGGTLTCSYSAVVPDAAGRTNTATATLQNVSFDAPGSATDTGTTDFSGTAAVDFLTATVSEVDATVNVTDELAGFPTLNFGPYSDSARFSYSRTLSCPDAEGRQTNTATIVETSQSDTADLDVVCEPYPGEEGCTPGFWQGGAGEILWDAASDADWGTYCGNGSNPYTHDTLFNSYFDSHPSLTGKTMYTLVGSGGTSDPVRKAARSLVAAYLNASCDAVNYGYSTSQLASMWSEAVAGTRDFEALHNELDKANNAIGGCNVL